MTIDMTIVINQFFLYPRSRTNFFRGHKAIDRNDGERYRPTEHTMAIFIDLIYLIILTLIFIILSIVLRCHEPIRRTY